VFIVQDDHISAYVKELKNLKNLQSPYFIRYFDHFEERGFIFYIITEYCQVKNIKRKMMKINPTQRTICIFKKGDLRKIINKHIDEQTKIKHGTMKKWTIEILAGLDFLHEKKLVHLDIKPENIFVEELERIKLGDVGMARSVKDISMSCSKGTLCYASPQLIKQKNINEKTDIW
jgi:NIMA (never in mitosis gene a)-related kinase